MGDVHNHAFIMEVVRIWGSDIAICVLAHLDIESPKDRGKMEEQSVIGNVETKTFPTTVSESGMTLEMS